MGGRKELVEEGPDKQIRKALALDQPTLLFETCAYYDENKLFKNLFCSLYDALF